MSYTHLTEKAPATIPDDTEEVHGSCSVKIKGIDTILSLTTCIKLINFRIYENHKLEKIYLHETWKSKIYSLYNSHPLTNFVMMGEFVSN